MIENKNEYNAKRTKEYFFCNYTQRCGGDTVRE